MEPWDGPASIAFTDGVRIGATLDRNGLRPARYCVTDNGLILVASEVGVIDLPPESIVKKGRLQPGHMLLVDTAEGRIVSDEELKRRIASSQPYQEWINQASVRLSDLPPPPAVPEPDRDTLLMRQHVSGYTYEDVRMIINPMATDGAEPIGSMGTDTPLAVLSEKPQLLFNYFKQLFAQVTNPPIDAVREEVVILMDTAVGPEGNLLEPGAESCRQLALPSPVLRNSELEQIRALDGGPASGGLKAITLATVFDAAANGTGLRRALEDLRWRVSECLREGYNIIILSDRGHDADFAPIPSLLAVSAVHHHLIREGTRCRLGLIVESGEPREVHHFATLIALRRERRESISRLRDYPRPGAPRTRAGRRKRGRKAVYKGCQQGYHQNDLQDGDLRGAELSRRSGVRSNRVVAGLHRRVLHLDSNAHRRHRHRRCGQRSAHAPRTSLSPKRVIVNKCLPSGGQYKFNAQGEHHLFNPDTVHRLQQACRKGNYATFKEYSQLVEQQAKHLCTLRGLMDFLPLPKSGPPRGSRAGRNHFAPLQNGRHELRLHLAGGARGSGRRHESHRRQEQHRRRRRRPRRVTNHCPTAIRRTVAIKQVASGRFGVTSEYLVNADEIQIKMAQGAKPGEGGQLPGSKVYPWIAKVRHATPGVGLISPPPHHDIYSIEDLAELIYDLKNANPRARITVKLVAEARRRHHCRGRGQGTCRRRAD